MLFKVLIVLSYLMASPI